MVCTHLRSEVEHLERELEAQKSRIARLQALRHRWKAAVRSRTPAGSSGSSKGARTHPIRVARQAERASHIAKQPHRPGLNQSVQQLRRLVEGYLPTCEELTQQRMRLPQSGVKLTRTSMRVMQCWRYVAPVCGGYRS